MSNIFLENPPRVAILGVRGKKLHVEHTQVFLGDIPEEVRVATNAPQTKTHQKILAEYYGDDYAEKLAPATMVEHAATKKGKGEGLGPLGLDLDIDLEDIAKALEEHSMPENMFTGSVATSELVAKTFEGPLSFARNTHIFPEDSLADIKEKAQITTGIPTYRQHLFYMTPQHTTPYVMYMDGFYPANILECFDTEVYALGLPVDKYLFDNRSRLRVEAFDTFRLATDTLGSPIYILDIMAFLSPNMMAIRGASTDTYQMEVIYWGFVVKYWPQLSFEAFRDLLRGEVELYSKYPALAKPTKALARTYVAEQKIITQMYRSRGDADHLVETGKIQVAITQVTIFVPNTYTPINARNLFDLMKVSAKVPEIRAYFIVGGKSYETIKKYKKSPQSIEFPPGIVLTGVIAALAVDVESSNPADKYMFLNVLPSGGYACRAHFPDYLEYDFINVFEKISETFSPVVARINDMTRAVFPRGGRLSTISVETVNYRNLSMYIFWKKHINNASFQALKAVWDPYITANIINRRPIQGFDRFEFNFIKGMYEFDRSAISRVLSIIGEADLLNQYIWLVSASAHSRWQTLYGHRAAKMLHRVGDVRFEVANIHEREFQIFFGYVVDFILRARSSDKFKDAASATTSHIAAIHHLREFDPDLYNIKRTGSKHVYSRHCQKGHQPRAWSPENFSKHLASLPAAERERLRAESHRFWNFTHKTPAVYVCPGPKYPKLHFMIGYHPKGYCMPCCKKLAQNNQAIFSSCLQKHSISRESDTSFASRHVMKPDKNPIRGRLAHIPADTLARMLGDPAGSEQYYLVGVDQAMPGNSLAGMFYSAAFMLGRVVGPFMMDLAEHLSRRNILEVANGILAEYFQSTDELLKMLSSMRSSAGVLVRSIQTVWDTILVEYMADAHDIYILVFDSASNRLVVNRVLSGGLQRSNSTRKYAIVSLRDGYINPVVGLDVKKYFQRSPEISSRVFSAGHPAHASLQKTVDWMLGGSPQKFSSRNIPPEYSVESILTGKTRRVYAVVLTGPAGKVYSALPFEDPKLFSAKAIPRFPWDSEELHWGALRGYLELTRQPVAEYWAIPASPWMAAVTSSGPHWFLATEQHEPTRKLSFDPRMVNEAILSGDETPTKNPSDSAGRAYYTNYLYRIFVGEFVHYLDGERDHDTRKRLHELISAANFSRGIVAFKQQIQLLVPAEDYTKLVEQISRLILAGTFSKKRLRAVLDNTNYSFDRLLFREIADRPHDEVVAKIRAIAKEFAVDGKIAPGEFPNIYLNCADDQTQLYCAGRKLICERPVEELADLLAGDLASPLMRRYIVEFSQQYVNFFKFAEHPDETISVKILV